MKEEPVIESMTMEMRQLILLLMQCEENIEYKGEGSEVKISNTSQKKYLSALFV